jgi:transcriptional regulator with XRE-family HTH domain
MTPHELIKIMQKQNWSGTQLARALGVAQPQIPKWRSGLKPIPERHAVKIRELAASNSTLKSPDEKPWQPPESFGPRRTKEQKQQAKAARAAPKFVDPAAIDPRQKPIALPSERLDYSGLEAVIELQRNLSGEFDLPTDLTSRQLPAVRPATPRYRQSGQTCAAPDCGEVAAFGRVLCSQHAATLSHHPMSPQQSTALGTGERTLLESGMPRFFIPTPAATRMPVITVKARPPTHGFGVKRPG